MKNIKLFEQFVNEQFEVHFDDGVTTYDEHQGVLESSTDGYYTQLSGPPKKADYIRFISSMADLPERLKMGLNLWYDGAIPGNRVSAFLSTLSDMAGKRLTKKTIHGMLKAHDNAEDAYEEFAEVYIKESVNEGSYEDFITDYGREVKSLSKKIQSIGKKFDSGKISEEGMEKAFKTIEDRYDKEAASVIDGIMNDNGRTDLREIAQIAVQMQNRTGTEMQQIVNAMEDFIYSRELK